MRNVFAKRVNRALLRSRTRRACRFAVLHLELDRLSQLRAAFGRSLSDALLAEIARRLRTRFAKPGFGKPCGDGVCVERGNGGEFVLLVPSVRTSSDAIALANEVLTEACRPFTHEMHEVYPTASVGIVVSDPSYLHAEELLRDAEAALYESRRAGRSNCTLFKPGVRERLLRSTKLEHDLWSAIEERQLALVYQPIHCLSTAALHGVEALLRWEHPQLGPIGPDEFIPLAEESALILELGHWVLEEGCRQLADWTRRLGSASPPLLSLNLSRKQFACPNLLNMIRGVVERSQIDPHRLQLEVTEDMLVSDAGAAVATMHQINASGLQLAIDDFGKGYSSFASLHQFPVAALKVDRSMIKGIDRCQDSAALLHSLAVLVHNLGIHLVCEGIEEPGQVLALQELGGHYGQGYYFSPPLTASALEEYLGTIHEATYCVGGALAFANRWQDRLRSFHALDPGGGPLRTS